MFLAGVRGMGKTVENAVRAPPQCMDAADRGQ